LTDAGSQSAEAAKPGEDEINVLDLLLVLSENARLLVLAPLAAGLVALGIAFIIPPTFTATTRILPPQQQSSTLAALASQAGALSGLGGVAGLNIRNPADLYVALIQSRTVADRMIDRFGLLERYDVQYRDDARKALAKATSVSSGKDGLVSIEVDDGDPMRAAEMANAYVEELFTLNGQLAITDAQQRRVFFEGQLRSAHEQLKSAQLALGASGVSESLVKSSPEAIVGAIATIKAQITAQEIKLSTMRGYVTEQNPEYRLAKRELESLRTQLAQLERAQPAQGVQNVDYLNRYRDFKYQETLFELMTKQYEIARLDEAREGAVIQVVDKAVPPERKSRPKRALIAVLTALAAGLLLVLYVFARESLRLSARHPESSTKLARIRAGLRKLVPGRS